MIPNPRVGADDEAERQLVSSVMVNHPPHYKSDEDEGGIECIDAIRAALGRQGFIAFLQGQVMKYTWRLGKKGPASLDAGKCKWYQDKLVEVLNEGL